MENMVTMNEHNNLNSIYSRKKIFLTGHTGFKGSWLLSWLHLLGAEIKGYSLAPESEDSLYCCIDGDKLCDSTIANIIEKEKVKDEILAFQPDFIFHLAAQPLVRLSYENPVETINTNVIGTVNVLDALRYLEKPCAVVIITTDKVYENKEWLYAYRENDTLGGYDPYSASKACTELVVSAYRNSFFNISDYKEHKKLIASARAGNVIGGGDWAKDRIIPDIIMALTQNQVVNVRNPYAVRPWQHVLDPLFGYLQLGSQISKDPQKHSGPYNFGPNTDDTLTVEDLVKTAIDIWGRGEYKSAGTVGEPHEAGLLKLDINKAAGELNWKPKLNARKAITWTIDWYKKPNQVSKKKAIFEQILNYSKL